MISSLYAPRIVPWASHLASFPTLLLLVFFSPPVEFDFKELITVILHYLWLITSRLFYYFFSPATHRVLWPLLKWIQQQQGKQTPICTIKDFKDRKALMVFIHFFILAPERMFLFSVHSLLKHFPVFLSLTLYSTSIWFQYLLCFGPALTDTLKGFSLLLGLTTLFLTLLTVWFVCLPKWWVTIITLIIRWAREGRDIKL